MNMPATPEPAKPPVAALRERLLAGLLRDPATLLVERDDGLARIRLTVAGDIAILACPDEAAAAGLPPKVDALTRGMAGA